MKVEKFGDGGWAAVKANGKQLNKRNKRNERNERNERKRTETKETKEQRKERGKVVKGETGIEGRPYNLLVQQIQQNNYLILVVSPDHDVYHLNLID